MLRDSWLLVTWVILGVALTASSGRSQTVEPPKSYVTTTTADAKTPATTQGSSATNRSANQGLPGEPATAMHLQLSHMLEQLTPYKPALASDEPLAGHLRLAGHLHWCGSTTMSELGHQWVQRLRKIHPDIEITTTAEGSEIGLEKLATDPTLLVGVSRPVDEEDLKRLLAGKCKEPIAILVGLEAMAVFVHKSNPIESVSPALVRAIFAQQADGTPQAKQWRDVGVGGELATSTITVHERGQNSGSEAFISKVLLSGAKMVPTAKPSETNSAVCAAIAADPSGIGFGDLRFEHPDVRRVPLQVQGQVIQATDESVLSGRYPLMRPLLVVLDKSQLGNDARVRESVLRFILSRDGQSEVIKAGYFPLDPGYNHHQLNELFGDQLR